MFFVPSFHRWGLQKYHWLEYLLCRLVSSYSVPNYLSSVKSQQHISQAIVLAMWNIGLQYFLPGIWEL